MAKVIDVPATFNNCFFHCLAAYSLLNEHPLPSDLFDVSDTALKDFATYFHDEASFHRFFERQAKMRNIEYSKYEFLVEKLLLLGLLFRQYYANCLRRETYESPYYIRFKDRFLEQMAGLEAFIGDEGDIEELCKQAATQFGLLIQANIDYCIRYFKQKRAAKTEGSEIPPGHEDYFQQVGLGNFITLLETQGETVSEQDGMPFANIMGIPLECITVQDEATTPINKEVCELVLDQEHYYLRLEDGEVADKLSEAFRTYRLKREEVLAEGHTREAQETLANDSECLFLTATLPKDDAYGAPDPLSYLISSLAKSSSLQAMYLPQLSLTQKTDAYLDDETPDVFVDYLSQMKASLLQEYFDGHSEVAAAIEQLYRQAQHDGRNWLEDEVLYELVGDESELGAQKARILAGIQKAYLEVRTEADLLAWRTKFDFLNVKCISELEISDYYTLFDSTHARAFAALINAQSDELVQKKLQALYRTLHLPNNFLLSERVIISRLILETFAPLSTDPSNIALFEKRLARLNSIANEMEGHPRLAFKVVGGLFLGLVVALGVACALGTVGLGLGLMGGAALLMMSAGFFSRGKRKGLSKSMHAVSTYGTKAISHKEKLNQVLGGSWTLNEEGEYYCEAEDYNDAEAKAGALSERLSATSIKVTPKIIAPNTYIVSLSHITYGELKSLESPIDSTLRFAVSSSAS